MDQAHEEAPKKGRQRKKLLYSSIVKQMEFYFSDSNLTKDRFLSQLIAENEYVDLSVFLKFNKILKITTSVDDIVKSLRKSELLELSEDKTKVKRTTPVKIKTNMDECTLYVQHVKSDTTHERLETIFSDFGKVVYVSLPKYKKNNLNKGFAFIEYDNEDEAKKALEFFEKIGCKISSPPEELCSITTFHEDVKEEFEESKKRKFSEDDDREKEEVKRVKLESETEMNGEVKEKKKKSNKKKFKELGFEVLTKREWKAMRNRYLNMQRTKMKELKWHLLKKKFGTNRFDDKRKQQEHLNVKKESDVQDATAVVKTEKMEFTPGVIIKLKLSEPYADAKKLKNELKSANPSCLYVDAPVTLNNDQVYLRFSCNESAQGFSQNCERGSAALLEGEEEREYWAHIKTNRDIKCKKETKRLRGREKLLKKAERELGKHIRFDNE